MFLFLVICFLLIISFFIAFMNGAITDLTQEKYNAVLENQPDIILKKIWDQYNEINLSLIFLNIFFYLL